MNFFTFLLSVATTYSEYNICCYTACMYRIKQHHVDIKHSYSFILSQLEHQLYNCCRTIYLNAED